MSAVVKKIKQETTKSIDRLKKDQTLGAQRVLLEQLFHDMYGHRWRIYKTNFVRGLFFGLGSVLGGTILLALLVWFLSAIGSLVPFTSNFIQEVLNSLSSS